MIQQPHYREFTQKNWKQDLEVIAPLMFTAAFTIANRWKQPKCPLTDEQIKKMRYMMDYLQP